jgi:hypothetical protein
MLTVLDQQKSKSKKVKNSWVSKLKREAATRQLSDPFFQATQHLPNYQNDWYLTLGGRCYSPRFRKILKNSDLWAAENMNLFTRNTEKSNVAVFEYTASVYMQNSQCPDFYSVYGDVFKTLPAFMDEHHIAEKAIINLDLTCLLTTKRLDQFRNVLLFLAKRNTKNVFVSLNGSVGDFMRYSEKIGHHHSCPSNFYPDYWEAHREDYDYLIDQGYKMPLLPINTTSRWRGKDTTLKASTVMRGFTVHNIA